MSGKRLKKHKWQFPASFRENSFGWRSSRLAVKRVREAVTEIKKIARTDPVLGGEGAVLFLERVSPALACVDSSSGVLGTAVDNAVIDLASIIVRAPANDSLRDEWLERLWEAVEEDEMPYIERLPEYWGELCVTPERASCWADDFIDGVKEAWSPNSPPGTYFKGIPACLSALFTAGRNEEILELLETAPYKMWYYRQWGVRALLDMGRKAEALRYAKNSRGLNESGLFVAEACEKILLSSGMADEAYNRYAFEANQKTTYLATFRAIVRKYPHKEPAVILRDLVDSTPGDEGKWFAAAKSVGLFDEAVKLANRTPCDPRTLMRASRDMSANEPRFALETGIAAIRWLVEGYGYEITGLDVQEAYRCTIKAAENAGCVPEVIERIKKLVADKHAEKRFAGRILLNHLGARGETSGGQVPETN